MRKLETPIPGLWIIEPQVFHDERGHFFEAHSAPKLAALGIDERAMQANQSFSKKGVLRGLHFQHAPHDQTKLVRCVSGRLFDAVVDIRRGSPTFGKWFGLELSAENKRMLYVPSGFAHGFYAVTDCEMLYICGKSAYDKASESGLRFDDPEVGIEWPLDGQPLVHPRDLAFGTISGLNTSFVFDSAIAVSQ